MQNIPPPPPLPTVLSLDHSRHTLPSLEQRHPSDSYYSYHPHSNHVAAVYPYRTLPRHEHPHSMPLPIRHSVSSNNNLIYYNYRTIQNSKDTKYPPPPPRDPESILNVLNELKSNNMPPPPPPLPCSSKLRPKRRKSEAKKLHPMEIEYEFSSDEHNEGGHVLENKHYHHVLNGHSSKKRKHKNKKTKSKKRQSIKTKNKKKKSIKIDDQNGTKKKKKSKSKHCKKINNVLMADLIQFQHEMLSHFEKPRDGYSNITNSTNYNEQKAEIEQIEDIQPKPVPIKIKNDDIENLHCLISPKLFDDKNKNKNVSGHDRIASFSSSINGHLSHYHEQEQLEISNASPLPLSPMDDIKDSNEDALDLNDSEMDLNEYKNKKIYHFDYKHKKIKFKDLKIDGNQSPDSVNTEDIIQSDIELYSVNISPRNVSRKKQIFNDDKLDKFNKPHFNETYNNMLSLQYCHNYDNHKNKHFDYDTNKKYHFDTTPRSKSVSSLDTAPENGRDDSLESMEISPRIRRFKSVQHHRSELKNKKYTKCKNKNKKPLFRTSESNKVRITKKLSFKHDIYDKKKKKKTNNSKSAKYAMDSFSFNQDEIDEHIKNMQRIEHLKHLQIDLNLKSAEYVEQREPVFHRKKSKKKKNKKQNKNKTKKRKSCKQKQVLPPLKLTESKSNHYLHFHRKDYPQPIIPAHSQSMPPYHSSPKSNQIQYLSLSKLKHVQNFNIFQQNVSIPPPPEKRTATH